MKFIGSILWGIILGGAAVLVHNAYMPFGLALALLGSGIGVWLVGRAWGLRRYKLLVAIGWILVVLRGGTPGVGREMLVQGNFGGNALIIAGFITVIVMASKRV